MKSLIIFALLVFVGCSSQMKKSDLNQSNCEIDFEDRNHYAITLTEKPFQVIENQSEMNMIFKKLRNQSTSTKMSPIPVVEADKTFIIFKPILKSTNDVEILKVYLSNENLYIDVKPFSNPQIDSKSRVSPNIFIKLLKKVHIKNLIINYKNP